MPTLRSVIIKCPWRRINTRVTVGDSALRDPVLPESPRRAGTFSELGLFPRLWLSLGAGVFPSTIHLSFPSSLGLVLNSVPGWLEPAAQFPSPTSARSATVGCQKRGLRSKYLGLNSDYNYPSLAMRPWAIPLYESLFFFPYL